MLELSLESVDKADLARHLYKGEIMKRAILDYLGNDTGSTLELPDDTTEEVWQSKLAKYAIAPVNPASESLKITIVQRKSYAEDLIERFKFKNVSEGINALQAMYMHHKMRALSVTFYSVPMTLDLMNMVVSGDIEVACLSLMSCTPDDMSQPFHWLNEDRINWLVTDMKSYLGWA